MDAISRAVPIGLVLTSWVAAASAGSLKTHSLPQTPAEVSAFSINEFEDDANAPALAASVPSEDWVRAWFKWANAPDLRGKGAIVQLAHAHGAFMGGGVTCSAIYRHENGISDREFMDLATRNPQGALYSISGSYYHGAIANPAYRSYVLHWAEQQIDAGVDTLFMDEVTGAYSVHEGYDAYGLAAFRRYLIWRFVEAQHWSVTDSRWKSWFDIDLADASECLDGTIRSFDYAAYLRRRGFASEPDRGENPLWQLWGDPNAIKGDSFSAERNNSAWQWWTTELRAYARRRHRRVWLAANGLNRWVDYQIAGIYGGFPRTPGGRLSCTGSSLSEWRSDYLRSRELLGGKDVPIMVFHDWGEGMPWEQLTSQERIAWLKAYAPEVFAAGLFFAFPVHGPFGLDASKDGTLPVIQEQARFVNRVAPLLHKVVWQDPAAARFSQPAEITLQAQPGLSRLIAHVINRSYRGLEPIPVQNGILQVALRQRPTAVKIYRVESESVQRLNMSFTPGAVLPGRSGPGLLEIQVPLLTSWDLVEIDLPRWRSLPFASVVRMPTSFLWERPAHNRISLSAGVPDLNCLPDGFIHGKLHPDLRNNPIFVVRLRRPGWFRMHLNSVSEAGAHLLVRVDGKVALQAPVADRDHRNDATAEEINRTVSVPVSPGLHQIAVNNDGPDWFTVDWFEIEGL